MKDKITDKCPRCNGTLIASEYADGYSSGYCQICRKFWGMYKIDGGYRINKRVWR